MKRLNKISAFLLVVSIFSTGLLQPLSVGGQDLVVSEDLIGGSSAFVFRKRPLARSGAGRVMFSANVRASSLRMNSQVIAAAAIKRREAAVAARKQAAVAAANRKITLSNTLTAKAEVFLDKGQTDLSITTYRDAIAQNPKNGRAAEGLSNALTGKGIDVAGSNNSEAAVQFFQEAVKLDTRNDVALAKLGAIYDTKGDTPRAIEYYEKAVALNPAYGSIQASLAQAYADKGEIAKSQASLAKAQAAGVDTVDVRFLNTVLLFKQNQMGEALAAVDKTLQLDGTYAPAHYYRGLILAESNDGQGATAAFRKAVAADPNYAPARFELAVASYNAGDYRAAASENEQVVRIEPTNYDAHANLASSYRQLERYSDANAEYKLAAEGIKTADIYSEWGYTLGKTNEWDESVARLATAKEISPTAIDNSNLGWGYYNAGVAKAEAKKDEDSKKNYARAREVLQVAVQLDPKLDAAYLNLGSTHNRLGEFQQAVQILKTLLGFRQNWLVATNQIGVGYRGLGDLANAISAFKSVVDGNNKNVTALYNLGEAYNAIGNKKEAKKINDQLKKLDPVMGAKLESVVSGKAVIDAAKQKVIQKIPRLPRFP
jgi:tetratricopeptide (TPR) repeat protein